MSDGPGDEHLIPVWIAFAEHFLDTETRPFLPLAALAAIDAGLSVEQARDIWCHDVTPVVGGNWLSVGQEWAGWDEKWLVERIRGRRKHRPGRFVRAVRTRFSLFTEGWYWGAIEKCMHALLAFAPEQRAKTAWDLRLLGGHYFDFCIVPGALSAVGRRDELERLFRRVFLPALGDLVVKEAQESRASCERRVEIALGAASG